MLKNPAIDQMRLDGGSLCLDFVNTIPDRKDGSNRDNLHSFNDLLYWAKKTRIIDSSTFALLEEAGEMHERKAREFFEEAINLRSLIYSIFHPISLGKKAKPADLEAFNALTGRYAQHLQIALVKGAFVEQWNFDADDFYNITAPILWSARELLLSGKLEKVKECPNCGWLFLDSTKNGRRKWCSMEDCGSNVKALEYYYRNKHKQAD